MLSSLLVQLCKMRTENEVGPWAGQSWGPGQVSGAGQHGPWLPALGLVVSGSSCAWGPHRGWGKRGGPYRTSHRPVAAETATVGGRDTRDGGGRQCPGWYLPQVPASAFLDVNSPQAHPACLPSSPDCPLPDPAWPLQHQMVDFSLCLN